MKTVEPILMPLQDLERSLADYNPREITEYQRGRLSASLDAFGVAQGVVYNTRTETVVGGHQTIRAALDRGDVGEMWVFPVDLDPGSEKALNIALNRISGVFDEDAILDSDGISFREVQEERCEA